MEKAGWRDRARPHFAKALEMNPKYEAARWLTAESYQIQGEENYLRGIDLSKEIAQGLKICEQAGSNNSYLLAAKSVLLSLRARSSANPQVRNEAKAQSKQLLAQALRLNPNLKSRYNPNKI